MNTLCQPHKPPRLAGMASKADRLDLTGGVAVTPCVSATAYSIDHRMSTLLLWAGVDSHGIASAYIATDSRLSSSVDLKEVWDAGQKAYCSTSVPLIAGYVGSPFYAAHVVPRLVAHAEVILPESVSSEQLLESLSRFVHAAISSAPRSHDTAFQIALAFRFSDGIFGFGILNVTASSVAFQVLAGPHKSAILHTSGTGGDFVRTKFEEWRKTNAADTSRAVYSAFCDALLHVNPPDEKLISGKSKDPQSEGPPQLVGIYRKPGSPGKYFGTVWKRKLYFAGIETKLLPASWECRNELFERCDPKSKKPLEDAKKHVDEVTRTKRLR